MGFRKAADGITKQGKTNADMKSMGRGMAKVAAQKKG